MRPEKEQEFKKILARLGAKDESVKEVDFSDFGLDDADVLLFLEALTSNNVTVLNLSYNKIGVRGAIALSKALPKTQVISLVL